MDPIKVFCYFNLHKQVWSVRAMEGPSKGLVIAHREYVSLLDVTAKISEAGRQRVIREGKKNVHAGLVGLWNDETITPQQLGAYVGSYQIHYNPYKYKTFVHFNPSGPQPFTGARLVKLSAPERAVNVYLIATQYN